MKKILIIGSIHGNEVLGEKLYAFILKNYSELAKNVAFKIGNLKAHKLNIRYIDADMNRSFCRWL